MPDSSPRLDLPYLQPAQAQKHVTHNEAIRRLDALVQLSLQALDAETPPAAPAAGQAFGLGPDPVGDWAGQGGRLAVWDGVAWDFATPAEGWHAFDLTAGRPVIFAGGGWMPLVPDLQNLDGVGIGTAADPVNRLTVAAEAVLLSHDGADHRLKINKAAAADTASLLFQSGWTGHAEIGLAGDTALAVKVSADGIAWTEALRADPAARTLAWAPAGPVRMTLSDAALQVDVPVTGAAVQSSPADTTADRLMKVAAFGTGNTGHLENLGDWDAIDKGSGRYLFSVTTSNLASKPAAYTDGNYGIVRIDRYSATRFTQTCWRIAGDAMPHMRSYQNGSWTAWERVFVGTNIVGTVSQSGGAPDGAIIERGSNANGSYTRWADGTQLCWNGDTAIATAPAAFAGTITKIDGDKLWIGRWF